MAKAGTLDDATASFIEDLGQFVAEFGLPPSMGRVFALLLVCEPPYRSAEDMQEQLKLSVGSVSSATTLLQQTGLVRRVTFPEDRRFYYKLEDNCWEKLRETRRLQLQRGVTLANEGLAINKDNPRLLTMRRLYEEFDAFLGKVKI